MPFKNWQIGCCCSECQVTLKPFLCFGDNELPSYTNTSNSSIISYLAKCSLPLSAISPTIYTLQYVNSGYTFRVPSDWETTSYCIVTTNASGFTTLNRFDVGGNRLQFPVIACSSTVSMSLVSNGFLFQVPSGWQPGLNGCYYPYPIWDGYCAGATFQWNASHWFDIVNSFAGTMFCCCGPDFGGCICPAGPEAVVHTCGEGNVCCSELTWFVGIVANNYNNITFNVKSDNIYFEKAIGGSFKTNITLSEIKLLYAYYEFIPKGVQCLAGIPPLDNICYISFAYGIAANPQIICGSMSATIYSVDTIIPGFQNPFVGDTALQDALDFLNNLPQTVQYPYTEPGFSMDNILVGNIETYGSGLAISDPFLSDMSLNCPNSFSFTHSYVGGACIEVSPTTSLTVTFNQ